MNDDLFNQLCDSVREAGVIRGNMIDMPKTNAKLTGKRCKCSVCSEVFSTESNFDKHRKGKYGIDRHCVNPLDVGLVSDRGAMQWLLATRLLK